MRGWFSSRVTLLDPWRLGGSGTIKKSPWMATVFGAKDARLATGATIETSDAEGGCGVWKSLDSPAAQNMRLSCIFARVSDSF